MKKVMINYWVDMITGVAFVFCALTGLLRLFPEWTVSMSSGGVGVILGIPVSYWQVVHDWSGVVMAAGVGVHTALHFKWLVSMSGKVLRGETKGAKGRARAPRAAQGAVTPGALPVQAATAAGAAPAAAHPATVSPAALYPPPVYPAPARPALAPPAALQPVAYAAGSADASLARLAALGAPPRPVPAGQRSFTRKGFLAAAGVAGVAALVGGWSLLSGGSSTSSTSSGSSTGSGADDDHSGSQNGYGGSTEDSGDGTSSSTSTDGSSSGSSTTTVSSDRVVVDAGACTGCAHCVQACPYGILSMSGRTAVVQNPDACQLCGHCVQVCRPAAITLNG